MSRKTMASSLKYFPSKLVTFKNALKYQLLAMLLEILETLLILIKFMKFQEQKYQKTIKRIG
jgi:hypothetical protein